MQDILKRPVQVGDTVLTKGYYSSVLNTIATVKKVNKDTIVVNVKAYNYNPSTQSYEGQKDMKRDRYSFIIINEQLAYNKETFPEFYI